MTSTHLVMGSKFNINEVNDPNAQKHERQDSAISADLLALSAPVPQRHSPAETSKFRHISKSCNTLLSAGSLRRTPLLFWG